MLRSPCLAWRSCNWLVFPASRQHVTKVLPYAQPKQPVQRLDFSDHKNAFQYKTSWELIRALSVLALCSNETFSSNSLIILKKAEALLGKALTSCILRPIIYNHFVAGDTKPQVQKTVDKLGAAGIGSIIAVALEEVFSKQDVTTNMQKLQSALDVVERLKCAEKMMQLRMTALFSMDVLKRLSLMDSEDQQRFILAAQRALELDKGDGFSTFSQLSEEHVEQIRDGMHHLASLGRRALAADIILMVDAEYTSINRSLSMLTQAMTLVYNRKQPIVWNTFQCYLKDAALKIQEEVAFAQKNNLTFGAKVVRGAYMVPEIMSAKQEGRPSPVHNSYEETSVSYNDIVGWLLGLIKSCDGKSRMLLASHNEESIHLGMQRMNELNIARERRLVLFAQVMGMSDHVTSTLGQAGYSVYKSLPYGSVSETLPYLSRRAQENSALIQNARRERILLRKELRRRMLPWSH